MMKERLQLFADQIRLETCRMLRSRGFGHLGGSLSIVETLAVLYGQELNFDSKNPSWTDRDYFVLSKGHGGPAYYSALALSGYFPVSDLPSINANGTNIPSHPDRLKTIGVDATTGSLGQGISIAVGMAKALKMNNATNRVHVIVGDGECNEGQVWEAMQFAAHNRLSNLIIYIDENHKQLDGTTQQVMNPFDLAKKTEAFGLYTQRVDGSDVVAISDAIHRAKKIDNQASCIVLDTVKGQGILYFESLSDNHHIRFEKESLEELDKAIDILELRIGGAK